MHKPPSSFTFLPFILLLTTIISISLSVTRTSALPVPADGSPDQLIDSSPDSLSAPGLGRDRSSTPLHLVPPPPPLPPPEDDTTSPTTTTTTPTTPTPETTPTPAMHPTPGIVSIPLTSHPLSSAYIQRIQEEYASGHRTGSNGGIPGWNPLWGIGPVVFPSRRIRLSSGGES
ncbi:hypothetical protein D9613_004692 [Agrocybe pediades]|uniref:Uncharacterized protein n=1 Tax=Agrocybe pediades TaxID=84607 RepID=A0A8H4QY32_9AGAR|nr:hypothetical protein D9613_004692 [Agrocybe pediades]